MIVAFAIVAAVAGPSQELDELDERIAELYAAAKFEEAAEVAQVSVEIRRRLHGDRHSSVASSLNNLAVLLHQMGRSAEAIPLFEEAISIRRETSEPGSADVAYAMNNLASMHQQIGDFTAARANYDEAIALMRGLEGAEATLGMTLGNFAALLQQLDDYEGALIHYRESIRILKSVHGKRDNRVAAAQLNLGGLLRVHGDLAAARETLEEATAILREVAGARHPDVAHGLNSLALLLTTQGDFVAAAPLYEEALDIRREALGPGHPLVAASMTSLAAFLRRKGEFDAALPLLEEALAIRREMLGDRHRAVAVTLTNLASVHDDLGDYTKAQTLFNQALEIEREVYGPRHRRVALTLNNLGSSLDGAGDHDAARPLLEESLSIYRESLGPRHPTVSVILGNLAGVLEALEDPGSRALRAEALDIAEARLDLLDSLEERVALDYVLETRSILDRWLDAFREPEHAVLAWTHTLAFKGAVARRLETARLLASVDPDAAKLASDLHVARREQARLAFAETTTTDERARMADLASQADAMEREMMERSADFRRSREARRVDPSTLCAGLPADAALLDLLRYGTADANKYLAFVTRAGDCGVHRVELGPADSIDNAVARWREALSDPVALSARVDRRGSAVYDGVWAPVEPFLAGAERVFVVSDSVLTAAPLGALPIGDERYLLEEVGVSYLDQASDLLEPPVAPASGALIVGGVDYDAESSAAQGGQRARMAPCNRGGFASLKGAAAEADLIAARWSRARKKAPLLHLGGADASEVAVTAAIGGSGLIHLATHGFFATGECRSMLEGDGVGFDPMLLSGLALAGANRPPDPSASEDGILTAAELATIDLSHAQLVVLSACETALGEIRSGEGVLGLRRAFSVAGAQTLVTSLWAVPDAETVALMDDFYRMVLHKRRPMPAVDALRAAQLEHLARQRERGEVRPQDWAGFVASGL